MPKVKTNRSAAKRFTILKSGKIRRGKAFGRHLMSAKTSKRRRNLNKSAILDPADEGRVKRLLPNG